MKRMKRTIITTIAAIAAILALSASPAAARAADVGVRMGYYFDADAVSLGTELLAPLDGDARWYFNPNVAVAMGDFRNTASLNADFHYDLQPFSSLAIWAGAGPALYMVDRPFDRGDEVNLAANAIFGLGAASGNVRPFAQFKGVLMSDPEAVLEFGLRF